MSGGQRKLTPFQFSEGIQERVLNKIVVVVFLLSANPYSSFVLVDKVECSQGRSRPSWLEPALALSRACL